MTACEWIHIHRPVFSGGPKTNSFNAWVLTSVTNNWLYVLEQSNLQNTYHNNNFNIFATIPFLLATYSVASHIFFIKQACPLKPWLKLKRIAFLLFKIIYFRILCRWKFKLSSSFRDIRERLQVYYYVHYTNSILIYRGKNEIETSK